MFDVGCIINCAVFGCVFAEIELIISVEQIFCCATKNINHIVFIL